LTQLTGGDAVSAVRVHTDVNTHPSLHVVPPPAQRRRTLPDGAAYALAASVIGLGLFASITPSPLYHAYSVLWHFSPLTLTLIYATFAFGVLGSLLLVGGVSDDVGRRPVLLVALGGLIGATVLFLLATRAAGSSATPPPRLRSPAPDPTTRPKKGHIMSTTTSTGTPIEGATALVTGGNRGFGRAIAEELLDRGAAKVYATSRSPHNSHDKRVVPLVLDVADDDSVAAAALAAPDFDHAPPNAARCPPSHAACDGPPGMARRALARARGIDA